MDQSIFLQNYSQEIQEKYLSLLSQHIECLPYTLSYPISQAVKKLTSNQYGAAMNHVLDFFEISTQYAAVVLLGLLKEDMQQGRENKSLQIVVNKIDNKRPLSFGDWVNDIFMPLLRAASEYIPEHPFVKSMGSHACSKRRNILLGGKKEASIVQIRNEYKGHSTTLSEEIYKGVLYTLEPRVMEMLRALSPLADYDFYTLDENQTVWSRTGIEVSEVLLASDKQQRMKLAHYYMCRKGTDSSEMLDLYPLVYRNSQNFIYIFQSLKDENASYISSSEDALTLITDSLNEDIDAYFQDIIPSFDITKELNWDELKDCTRKESVRFMTRIYKEKKYNQELFVDRERLSATLYQFWASDKTLFPLLGEAGQGKTNQLCFWTEDLMERNEAVLIFNSTDFSNYTLADKLNLIFGYSVRRNVSRLLNSLHEKAVKNNSMVYFFFDAINECLHYKGDETQEEGPLCLYKAIVDLLVNEEYSRFKVLFTCRSYTWKNLLQSRCQQNSQFIYNAGNEEELAVRGFTQEETYKAYHIYQRLYQMTTRYEDIDKKTLIRLRDPLVLKFVSSNYLGRDLSTNTSDYTSLSLFEKMWYDMEHSYAGKIQCEIVSCIGNYLLNSYMSGYPLDAISVEDIKASCGNPGTELGRLARLIYKKDGITVAYTELLNKAERPILKESERATGDGMFYEIRFIYERFLEFVMACSFIKRERLLLGNEVTPIAAETYVEAISKAVTNVVFMGVMRNVIVMDCIYTNDYSAILKLVAVYGDNYIIMQLLIEVMNLLIRENHEEQLFVLIDKMLSEEIPNGNELIARMNILNKKIESNQAESDTIAEYKILSKKLSPIIKLRKLASVSLINGVLLTDYFNEGLYQLDALEFLWRLMLDKIHDVRNDVCMYTYYLSNKTHTLDYTPLKGNLCEQIVYKMYAIIKAKPLLICMSQKFTRQRAFVFFETATRLGTLLILDALMTAGKEKRVVKDILLEIEKIARYFTVNFYLLRAFLPILQVLMRKQITFQATYVNNAVEYQLFWEKYDLPYGEYRWTKEGVREAMSFIGHHSRFHNCKESVDCLKEEERFRKFHPYVWAAYKTGDSFTYFTLERILIVMGSCKWINIQPCVERFFTDEYRCTEWFNYSQMSMLYILFQVAVYSEENIPELLEIYTRESRIWTLACKGVYRAPNSSKANPYGVYKRNVLTWYCVVYCQGEDGFIREGDMKSVPLFYELIDIAIQKKDKELLVHLIENIEELIADFGYIHTALDLLKYILCYYDTEEKVKEIDVVDVDRPGVYQFGLVRIVGNLLSTAKNYYPSDINMFIKKDLMGLSFPGVSVYREEILNYNPSGETLSDLFTHKFGKFLTWGLLFEETIDNFANEAMCTSVKAKDCFDWYNQVVRILLKHLFKLKI